MLNAAKPISIKRLAEEIGMDRSSCRRYVLSLGIEPVKRRTSDSHFQVALTLTPEQADRVRRTRAAEGYLIPDAVSHESTPKLAHISNAELIEELRRRLGFAQ
jgi:hypothetical protein